MLAAAPANPTITGLAKPKEVPVAAFEALESIIFRQSGRRDESKTHADVAPAAAEPAADVAAVAAEPAAPVATVYTLPANVVTAPAAPVARVTALPPSWVMTVMADPPAAETLCSQER